MKKQIAKVIKDNSGLAIELPESFFEDLEWDAEKDNIEWVIDKGQVKLINRSKKKEDK